MARFIASVDRPSPGTSAASTRTTIIPRPRRRRSRPCGRAGEIGREAGSAISTSATSPASRKTRAAPRAAPCSSEGAVSRSWTNALKGSGCPSWRDGPGRTVQLTDGTIQDPPPHRRRQVPGLREDDRGSLRQRRPGHGLAHVGLDEGRTAGPALHPCPRVRPGTAPVKFLGEVVYLFDAKRFLLGKVDGLRIRPEFEGFSLEAVLAGETLADGQELYGGSRP